MPTVDPRRLYRDRVGNWRTRSLFVETFDPSLRSGGYAPVFTLGDEDVVDPETGEVCVSLKQKYLSYLDPTEYKVASNCLGGLKHWEAVCSSKLLAPHIEAWRSELKALLAYKAYAKIIETMEASGSGRSFDAAKWLWSDNGNAGAKRSVGRPPKVPDLSSKADLDYAAELRRINEKTTNV